MDWVGWILDRFRSAGWTLSWLSAVPPAPKVRLIPAQAIGPGIKPQNIQSPERPIQNPRLCFSLLSLIGADHRLAPKLLICMAVCKKAVQFVVLY